MKKIRFSPEKLWMPGILLLYAVLLFFAIFHHEPWSDEAQAWLLARDGSLSDVLIKYLRYEGSPGLWHFLLMIPAKIHMPMLTMQILAGVIATSGVYVFLRFAPFPKIIKTFLPFTFFVLYQYAVVARAYVLFPLLFFLLASVFHSRRQHPYIFLTLLILISLVSLHGTVMAIGILFAHAIDILKQWKTLKRSEKREQIISAAIYSFLMVVLAFVLQVPKDYYRYKSFLDFSLVDNLIKTVIIFSDVLLTNIFYTKAIPWYAFILFGTAMFIWFTTFKLMQEKKLVNYFIIPLFGITTLLNVNFLNPWHTGVIFFHWIFLVWITWEDKPSDRSETWLSTRKIMIALIMVLILVQSYWSFNTLKFDYRFSYSGGKKTAEFIREHHLDNKKIYVHESYAAAFLGYFDRNIVGNLPDPKRSFMVWTYKEYHYNLTLNQIYTEQPDLIIIRSREVYGNYRPEGFLNYRFAGIYNGGLFWKDKIFNSETYLLFEKYTSLKPGKPTRQEIDDGIHTLGIDFHPDYLHPTNERIMGSY